jgi:hypothetical protein
MADRKRSFKPRGDALLASTVRLIRLIQAEKITGDKLSPEDYARMARLMDLLEDVLKP